MIFNWSKKYVIIYKGEQITVEKGVTEPSNGKTIVKPDEDGIAVVNVMSKLRVTIDFNNNTYKIERIETTT